MDDELEVIHSEMEATRKSLAGKLIEVETQIREGVAVAGDTVTNTVESVKDAVSSVTETVSSVKEGVKETFNVRKHVENHPLGAVGTAFAAGFVGGLFLGPAKTPASAPASGAASSGGSWSGGAWSSGPAASAAAPAAAPAYTPSSPSPAAASARREPGVFDAIFSQLQGLAITAVTNVAHNLVKEASPPDWQGGLTKVINDISAQLKGEPKPARGWKDGLSEIMETVTTQLTTPKADDGANLHEASQRKGPTQEPNPAWTGPASRPHEAHGAHGR